MTGPTTPPAAQQASRTRTAALSWQLAADSIDDLFQRALDQRGKASIIAMFDQVVALKRYAGWNAFLISVQRPGTVAVASASEWRTRFNRTILPLARPIVILHPFGPVRFVYDLTDTEGPDHPQLRWRDPFAVKTDLAPPSAGSMDRLYKTLDKRDGITVQVDDYGGLFAGVAMRVQAVPGSGQQTLWPQFRIRMARRLKPAEALVTLAHELGHVYCGHLGPFLTTKPQNGKPPLRPWDDRHAVLTKGQCEFEAESVGYLTAARNGIETRSAEYLAGYIAETDLPAHQRRRRHARRNADRKPHAQAGTAGRRAMKISTLLDHIDLGTLALPEFQRGYVWNRDQVRGLMASLYRRHPVGSLLVWATLPNQAKARGGAASDAGTIKLLLDGQQRITSLYGIVRGRPPRFFEGNAEAFTGLRFHLGSETFAFYSPLKMQDDPLWTDVTAVMQEGVGPFITRFAADPAHAANLNAYINRLVRVAGILDIDLHVEEVIGADKTVDVVVDIFNRVNSGGTKLSKGDLALAKVCAEWPEARAEMRLRLEKWRKAGFQFRLELLLRCMTTILTGEAMFDKLAEVTADEVRDGLHRAEAAVDKLLDLIGARLGLDHDRVLGSHYSFPLMAAYLDRRGGTFADWRERDRLLYWYIHSFLWGRYAGSTETVLNQDLAAIERPEEALDRLIALLRQNRGDLRLTPDDFAGWSRNARFYPLLYMMTRMMTRVCRARDWGSGLDLSAHMLSRKAALHMHHIFPKARLYKASYPRSEVNALANFTFLTWDTNVKVGDRLPEDYLPEYLAKHPGAVQSHWIPEDPALWRIGNYADFLAARRALLAAAANEFLDRLLHGGMAEVPAVAEAEPTAEAAPGGIAGPEEEAVLAELNEWVAARGLPDGECPYELADPADGTPLAVLDLAWPDGLQPRLSQPVALLLDEAAEVHAAALRAGFRVFDDAGAFRAYVVREVLAAEDTSAAAD